MWYVEALCYFWEPFLMFIIQAPGEAEAELGQLNAQGYIDAIITDNVDAFLFGANTVIRT